MSAAPLRSTASCSLGLYGVRAILYIDPASRAMDSYVATAATVMIYIALTGPPSVPIKMGVPDYYPPSSVVDSHQ